MLHRFQRAVPSRGIDTDRANLDAILARIAHDLRGGVEAHGLAVEQRGTEDLGMPAFQPGTGIRDKREAGGRGFGKTIAAETLELANDLLGELLGIAALDHA